MKSIIELAREAGFHGFSSSTLRLTNGRHIDVSEELTRFAALVRAQALEEAADVVENADTPDCGGWNANGIAAAIRQLKEKS